MASTKDGKYYMYENVGADTIRLLHFSKCGSEMTFDLLAFPIHKLPDYRALSYTWDGQTRYRSIPCNGASIAVTSNVQTVLPYLYERYGNHYVWVDVVCIDQDNIEEKNAQIPLMRTIYSKAAAVVIWLGVGDSPINEAIKEIPSILPRLDKFDGRLVMNDDKLLSHGLPISSSSVWCGVHILLSQFWFTRVWVFQEAVLSKKAYLMCGNHIIDADMLMSFVQGLASGSMVGLTRGSQMELENTAVTRGVAMLQKITLYRRWRATNQRYSLLTLLEIGRDFSATNDVDKVYGFLGLAPEHLRLRVDVTRLTAKVFIDVAKYDVASEPILNILHLASSNQRLPGLPSWCPNFAGPRETSKLIGYPAGYHAGFEDRVYNFFPFQATTSLDNDLLKLLGYSLDQVTKVVAPGWRWIQSPDVAPEIAAAAQSLVWEDTCLKLSQGAYPSSLPETVPEAHWRTLIANALNGKKCISDQREAYALMRLSLAIVSAKARQPERAHEIGTNISDAQAIAVEEYMRAVQAACNGRCFFTTRDGRIGLSDKDVVVGDLVYIILNTWTPFTLRPIERLPGRYRLIGEAYVHGLMYGEAFDIMGKNRLETIYLE